MNNDKKVLTYVHVTLAVLNRPDAFFTNDNGNGFTMGNIKIPMHTAVFCGKVLATKVFLWKVSSFNFIKEIDGEYGHALGICLDDGTGVHIFNDTIRNVHVEVGRYVKIFGAIKPRKSSNNINLI
jgi:hypothetical protein